VDGQGVSMGHEDIFAFVDPRDGEYGVSYSARSEQAIQALAEKAGYTGSFTRVVRAFPPRPSARLLEERARLELCSSTDDPDLW